MFWILVYTNVAEQAHMAIDASLDAEARGKMFCRVISSAGVG